AEPEPEPEPETGDAFIDLKGDTAESSSSKVSVNGSEVTIKAEGTYKISGTLNGCIIVAAPKDAKVDIELNGVNICNSNGSAIRVDTADKVKIISGSGSDNSLSDGGSSEACIFSKEDITLKGDGFIRINGNVKNAVQSKNTLKITGGTLEASSQNNGLVGKDKVAVEAGQITINCARDALKATNDSDAGKGVVYVTGGNINITAGDDIIQAISEITVNNCSINAKFEGKKANCLGAVNVDEGCITKIK
ncbi:MAG: carbohydrate-binding domain-containing protein, partial [Oscillospiraceae bacterium]|nr:carbohydrate-binding domain-containing protein [Oscillospiraceae bacterium]